MTDGSTSPAEWGERYRLELHRYADATERLRSLIEDLLAQAEIPVVQVECRHKTVDSFVEKIARKSAQYTAPLEEITDLAGIRVITYYLEDVTSVGEVIQAEFEVDVENSVDKTSRLDPTEFGYTGVHYVVGIGAARRGLPEWAGVAGLKAEIQIRTAAQHAWAAVDHKLNYKSKHEIPDGLRRRFYRLSALFELADDQFSILRREHESLEREYSESLRKGDLDIALDSASLEPYLEKNERVRRLVRAATEIGWEFVSPEMNRERAARDRGDLLAVLGLAEFHTIEQLDALLSDETRVREALSVYYNAWDEEAPALFLDDLLTALVIMLMNMSEALVRTLYAEGYAAVVLAAKAELLRRTGN